MPNLEIALAENSGVYSYNGIEVESDDGPLVLDFPSLYNASGIKLTGNFKRYHNQDPLFQQLTDPHQHVIPVAYHLEWSILSDKLVAIRRQPYYSSKCSSHLS